MSQGGQKSAKQVSRIIWMAPYNILWNCKTDNPRDVIKGLMYALPSVKCSDVFNFSSQSFFAFLSFLIAQWPELFDLEKNKDIKNAVHSALVIHRLLVIGGYPEMFCKAKLSVFFSLLFRPDGFNVYKL